MRNIRINTDGDLVMKNIHEPDTISDEEAIGQLIYLIINTGKNKWKGCPATGSIINMLYGKVLTNTDANMILSIMESELSNHPQLLIYNIQVELVKIAGPYMETKMTFTHQSIQSSINMVIAPFSNIMYKKGENDVNQDMLQLVQDKWKILNR